MHPWITKELHTELITHLRKIADSGQQPDQYMKFLDRSVEIYLDHIDSAVFDCVIPLVKHTGGTWTYAFDLENRIHREALILLLAFKKNYETREVIRARIFELSTRFVVSTKKHEIEINNLLDKYMDDKVIQSIDESNSLEII